MELSLPPSAHLIVAHMVDERIHGGHPRGMTVVHSQSLGRDRFCLMCAIELITGDAHSLGTTRRNALLHDIHTVS